jgi:hypothetical protein
MAGRGGRRVWWAAPIRHLNLKGLRLATEPLRLTFARVDGRQEKCSFHV